MDVYEPGTRRKNRARERYMARKQRSEGAETWLKGVPRINLPAVQTGRLDRAGLIARDALWYVTHTPYIPLIAVVICAALFGVFTATHVLGGRIFPNVWALGVNLADLTSAEASAKLTEVWNNQFEVQLVDGDRVWTVKPSQIGLRLDAMKTAEAARNAGMTGIPMGTAVTPVVSLDGATAQNYLLDMTSQTDVPPYNAGYQWQGDQLVGLAGKDGKMLDVPRTVDALSQNTVQTVATGRAELLMNPVPPLVSDPKPYLDIVKVVTSKPFILSGYDPFTDQTINWSTNRDALTSWLEAGENGLNVRDDTFVKFLNAVQQASFKGDALRYLDPKESKEELRKAVNDKQNTASLRIRYRPQKYEVQRGDSGYRISRKTGIPFYLIDSLNKGRDWSKLSPGDMVELPTRDVTLPIEPVRNKRIVVNLDTQSMVAYENGQEKFRWLISSGMDKYPTSPGIYQILGHEPEAAGGSFTMCGDAGCGQWTMYWFMGIYEVTPGLMNGFHGAVLLPGNRYLGGGNVGSQYTFGCVMATNDNAKLLYDWADEGTIVEIISSEFAPQSDLGRAGLAATANGL
jgi:LysM repeat protein